MQPTLRSATPASYVAELTYEEDARRRAHPRLGCRSTAVMRCCAMAAGADRAPTPARRRLGPGQSGREHGGDAAFRGHHRCRARWTAADRLALSSIAGLDLACVSDEGSHWFGTRRRIRVRRSSMPRCCLRASMWCITRPHRQQWRLSRRAGAGGTDVRQRQRRTDGGAPHRD